MVKVSIVMSVFNCREYIRRAVESILEQSYSDFEFIIIEDGSSDGTKEILQKFADNDKRIKLIINKENTGIEGFTKNLNYGLELAQGEYIARMDADDISLAHRILRQVEFLDSNKNIFLVGSLVRVINEDDVVQKHVKISFDPSRDLEKANLLYHPTIMFRKSALRYRQKMRYCEDYDFYLQILSNKMHIRVMQEELLEYRILSNSISRSKFQQQYIYTQAARYVHANEMMGNYVYDDFNPDEYLQKFNKGDYFLLKYNVDTAAYINDLSALRTASIVFLQKYKFSIYGYLFLFMSYMPLYLFRQIKNMKTILTK
jgi:glycosyltransferase involved in cell wall biosynthesis